VLSDINVCAILAAAIVLHSVSIAAYAFDQLVYSVAGMFFGEARIEEGTSSASIEQTRCRGCATGSIKDDKSAYIDAWKSGV
jgi:hypothetical protein